MNWVYWEGILGIFSSSQIFFQVELECLIANSDGFILTGFLNYHPDFISIILSFLKSTICFDESSSFGEQSNKEKSDMAYFITAFSLVYFSLIFSMQILSRHN